MGSLSIWHWIVVIVVILLLFGRNKISDLMGDVAQGIKAFRKGMSEDDTAKQTPPADGKTIDHQATTQTPPQPQANPAPGSTTGQSSPSAGTWTPARPAPGCGPGARG